MAAVDSAREGPAVPNGNPVSDLKGQNEKRVSKNRFRYRRENKPWTSYWPGQKQFSGIFEIVRWTNKTEYRSLSFRNSHSIKRLKSHWKRSFQ